MMEVMYMRPWRAANGNTGYRHVGSLEDKVKARALEGEAASSYYSPDFSWELLLNP